MLAKQIKTHFIFPGQMLAMNVNVILQKWTPSNCLHKENVTVNNYLAACGYVVEKKLDNWVLVS
jgi:hypothetical protein